MVSKRSLLLIYWLIQASSSVVGLLKVEAAWQKVCFFRCRQERRCGITRSMHGKRRTPPPTSNLPKVVVIRAVPSCRNAVSWDTIIAPKADSEGEEKKRLWERTRGERWIERQPNVYSPLTKARPVHMLVMELPWHTVKWGIMMTKHCPRTKECERRVKKVNAERASCILVLWLNRDAATGRMSPLSQVWVHLFEIKSEKKRGRWKGIIKDPPSIFFLDWFWIP